MIALLEPVIGELAHCPLNFSVLPVGDTHLLAVAFDAEADLGTVQTVGREGAQMIAEILSATTSDVTS